MRKFITFFVITLFVTACAGTRTVYVPTDAKTIIEYRDTTIYLKDTVYISLPVEEKQNTTLRDSSHLETSIATSDAWITDDGRLNHTLRNKQESLKAKLDTTVKVQYLNKYIEKEVINEVEVEKPYIPKIAWICIIFTCCWVVVKIAKIIWKFKGLK